MSIIANKEYWCGGFKLSATGRPYVNLKPTLGRATRYPTDPYEQVINSTKVTSAYYFRPYNKARDGFIQKHYSLHDITLCETREEYIDEYNRQVQAEIDKHKAIIDDCRKKVRPILLIHWRPRLYAHSQPQSHRLYHRPRGYPNRLRSSSED